MNAYEILASTALQAWKEGGNESHVAQEMHKKVSQSPFDTLYLQLRMRIDADKRTHEALNDS